MLSAGNSQDGKHHFYYDPYDPGEGEFALSWLSKRVYGSILFHWMQCCVDNIFV